MDAARRLALGASPSGEAAPGNRGRNRRFRLRVQLWEEAQRGQSRRALSFAAALAAIALVAEVIYIPIASPRFAVRAVEVRGDEQVARAVTASIHLPANANMLRAPLKAVKRQAESCSAVREARVWRAFPDRIIVTVERREPVAVVRRNDAAVLIDPDGVPFTVAEEWGWGLPELSAPNLASGELTSPAARSEIRDLLAVLRALGPDPRLRVTRLQLGRDGRLELTLDSGTVVDLGAARDLGAKARLLVAAIEQIGVGRIKRLDLSIPRSAWWEPREGRQSAGAR